MEKKEITTVGIAGYLNTPAVKENIEGVLGKDKALSLISDVVSCVQATQGLAKCTNKSILNAALVAKAINLPLTPQLGYAWLVPYTSKKEINGQKQYVDEAQFQIGYKGYVQLALRSEKMRKLIATDVRKGEIQGYDPFEDHYIMQGLDDFEKRIAKDDKGNWVIPIIGYYAKFELNNGFVKEMFMNAEDMKKYALKYSKAYRSDVDKHTSFSFWSKNFEDMAKKTMLRQLLGKWGLLTPELEKAYVSDMAVIDEDGNPDYVDNKPDESDPAPNPFKQEEITEDNVIDAEFEEVVKDAPFK